MTDPSADRSFLAFTTTRPVAITMMVVAAVVFGVVGLRRLPVNLLPDISHPTVTVRTQYPGSSPEDVEDRVSERVQEAVSVVPGVQRVVSISRPGVSDVVLEFVWGTQMTFAVSDVSERLDRVYLPREAERPLVLRYDPSLDPVVTIGLFGEHDLVELRRIAEEEVERELAKVEGVAAVKVRGGDEEEIRIQIDEAALTVLGLDLQLLGERLAAENINSASGSIDEGKTEFLVRTLGEYRTLDEIADTIIERRNEAPIRLRDVARVVRVPQDKEVISRVDGQPCVLVDVYREANANIVELAGQVRDRTFGSAAQQAYVAGLRSGAIEPPDATTAAPGSSPAERMAVVQQRAHHREMTDFLAHQLEPTHTSLALLQDQSKFIQTSIDDVKSAAIQGGMFAIVVIFLFLRRLSATVILALSIPISLIASFAPMFLSDITLNIMSLGGLALGVGMLVDNSIVVLEAITRAREDGHGVREAAVIGTRRVAGAVTASTLTTVAVFFPIVFVEGVAGQLFRDQSLTVVYSLLISLLVAVLVIPMLASRGADDSGLRAPPTPPRLWVSRQLQRLVGGALRLVVAACVLIGRGLRLLVAPVLWVFDRGYSAVENAYPRVLQRALRVRFVVMLGAIALLAIAAHFGRQLGSELIPEVSQGEMFVELFLPRDATVERTDAVAAPLEREIAAMPEVESTFLAVGVDDEELNSSEEGEHSAKILVRLAATEDAAATEEVVRVRVRELLRRTPEVMGYRFSTPSVLAFSAPLVVEVVGDDLVALRRTSAEVARAMATVPGLRDVRSTLQRGNPEIVLRLDREKMSALGIDSAVVSRILSTKVQGDVPTRFADRDRKIDMRVAMPREELDRVQRLLELNVNPAGDPSIPLQTIAEVQILEGPSEIRRLGNTRGAEIQAAVQGFDIGSAQARVEDVIADIDAPPGIEVRMGSQKGEMERSMQSIYLALGLAVFLVYVVMASQFESLVQPFVILCSLPLALVGVVFTLLALDVAVSVIALLGGIVLAGIVVNNAIILVDQINKLRAEGMPKMAAIVEGGRTRLRPVLMTTTTTVLGLLPLTGWLVGVPVLGGGTEGIELRAPLAITLVAGLVSSTLLTLLVIPCVYSISDRRA